MRSLHRQPSNPRACHTDLYALISSYGPQTARMHSAACSHAATLHFRPELVHPFEIIRFHPIRPNRSSTHLIIPSLPIDPPRPPKLKLTAMKKRKRKAILVACNNSVSIESLPRGRESDRKWTRSKDAVHRSGRGRLIIVKESVSNERE